MNLALNLSNLRVEAVKVAGFDSNLQTWLYSEEILAVQKVNLAINRADLALENTE